MSLLFYSITVHLQYPAYIITSHPPVFYWSKFICSLLQMNVINDIIWKLDMIGSSVSTFTYLLTSYLLI